MVILFISYYRICQRLDEPTPHVTNIGVTYIKEAVYDHGNDCRSNPGRNEVMVKSAPVRERSAVVQTPGMRPNDRTRTYDPGKDNCIGLESPSDAEVAA